MNKSIRIASRSSSLLNNAGVIRRAQGLLGVPSLTQATAPKAVSNLFANPATRDLAAKTFSTLSSVLSRPDSAALHAAATEAGVTCFAKSSPFPADAAVRPRAAARRAFSATAAATAKPARVYYDPSAPAKTDVSLIPAEDIVTVVQQDKLVASWLFFVAALVFVMVVVGGLTRLTKSGLSMVHWKFFGEKRPVSEADWVAEFERYKASPEYRLHNDGMSLKDFKFIYHMEFGHRSLGRFIGLAFGLPFLGFLATKRLPLNSRLTKLLTVALGLGGLQGYIGWWMVKSGLTEEDNKVRAKVSPYRLATHLISAFTLFGLLTVGGLQAWRGKAARRVVSQAASAASSAAATVSSAVSSVSASAAATVAKAAASAAVPTAAAATAGASPLTTALPIPASFALSKVSHWTAMLAGLTAFSGAFVAGNEAGLIYNEFPFMGEGLIPSDLINPYLDPAWKNIFEHPTFVQFTHRCLAMTTTALAGTALVLSRSAKHTNSAEVRSAAALVGGAMSLQVALGITTLYSHVHTHVAASHQAGALFVLATAVNLVYRIKNPRVQAAAALATGVAAPLKVKAIEPEAAEEEKKH